MLLFSGHARLRMTERKIKEAAIIETLSNPDNLIEENGQYTAVKQFGNTVLVVVYTKSDNIDFVITVISSSKLAKYLKR
jgi:hypothetical protein